MKKLFFLTLLSHFFIYQIDLLSQPFPIGLCIPEEKILSSIAKKTKDFAHVIPGIQSTYIFTDEQDYYNDYKQSYFAVTTKKGGWDCLRHYEILANGCIPYFVDLDSCDPNTMTYFPKDLVREAMNLEGVCYLSIDHEKFDKKKYYEILEKLVEHTKTYLTTKAMAQSLLDRIGYAGTGKILFLSFDQFPDYQRCLTLIGLKQIFPETVVDYPKIEHIYKSYKGDTRTLYGRGFSYTKIINDCLLETERACIEKKIKNHEFDLIVYGSIHRGCLYADLVHETYSSHEIVYICGEDMHTCEFAYLSNLFLREQAVYS